MWKSCDFTTINVQNMFPVQSKLSESWHTSLMSIESGLWPLGLSYMDLDTVDVCYCPRYLQVGSLKTSLEKAQAELSEVTHTNTELKSQLHLVKQTHHSSLQDMTTADRSQYLAQVGGLSVVTTLKIAPEFDPPHTCVTGQILQQFSLTCQFVNPCAL